MPNRLPRNVALIRVKMRGHHLVLVSDRLTHDQELAARVMAAILSVNSAYVLITCTDLLAAMSLAA